MPVPCVPPPSFLFGPGREVDRLFYLQPHDVEAVHRAPNLHQLLSIVPDLELFVVNGNVLGGLIELTQAHKVLALSLGMK